MKRLPRHIAIFSLVLGAIAWTGACGRIDLDIKPLGDGGLLDSDAGPDDDAGPEEDSGPIDTGPVQWSSPFPDYPFDYDYFLERQEEIHVALDTGVALIELENGATTEVKGCSQGGCHPTDEADFDGSHLVDPALLLYAEPADEAGYRQSFELLSGFLRDTTEEDATLRTDYVATPNDPVDEAETTLLIQKGTGGILHADYTMWKEEVPEGDRLDYQPVIDWVQRAVDVRDCYEGVFRDVEAAIEAGDEAPVDPWQTCVDAGYPAPDEGQLPWPTIDELPEPGDDGGPDGGDPDGGPDGGDPDGG